MEVLGFQQVPPFGSHNPPKAIGVENWAKILHF